MKTKICCLVVVMCGTSAACGSSPTNTSNAAQGAGNDAGGMEDAGGPTTTPVDSGTADAAIDTGADADSGLDHGAPSNTYPAFPPSFGQIVNNHGLVMSNPVIVPITWSADPSQAMFQSFADDLGQTAYWKATTSEYGIGAAVSGTSNHVSVTTMPPASLQDSDLQNMVTSNAGKNGWPAPTDQTIYAFFLPPGTLLQMGMGGGGGGGDAGTDACSQGVGGYHDQVTVGSVTTSYAVVPSCSFGSMMNTAAQQSTMSMSHEIIEAVTDPHPQDNKPGYVGFDQDHFGFDWFLEFQDEIGDACEIYKESFFQDMESTPVSFDDWVQRTWSNKAGPLGHDPCVPAPSTPYFNVAPLGLKEVTITLPAQLTGTGSSQNIQVLGVSIPVGKSGTVELGFYSDGPTSGPWDLTWGQGSPFLPTPPTYLSVTIDKTSGQNGEKAYATVTPTSAGKLNAELLWFKSTLNGVKHVMPVVVSSYEAPADAGSD